MSYQHQEILDVFQFRVGDYNLGVDISTLEGIKKSDDLIELDETRGFFLDGDFQEFTLIDLADVFQCEKPVEDTPQILLRQYRDRHFGVIIHEPKGIISLGLRHLFLIPTVLKSFIPDSYWAVGLSQTEIVVLVELEGFLSPKLIETTSGRRGFQQTVPDDIEDIRAFSRIG